MIKNKRIGCLWIVVLTAFLIVLSATVSYAQPKIELSEEAYDFGTAYQNQKLNHVLGFKNAGDKTLKIDRVKAA